jgi:hypothetical protein
MEVIITLVGLLVVFIIACRLTSYDDEARDQAYYYLLLGGHIHSGHS